MEIVFEDPPMRIRGRVTAGEFQSLFPSDRLSGKLYHNYGDLWCDSALFHGLRCGVGFRFDRFPRLSDELLLCRIAFSAATVKGGGLAESFGLVQKHFESIYGPADVVGTGHGFPEYRWALRDDGGMSTGEIRHYVSERFDLEEHLCISF